MAIFVWTLLENKKDELVMKYENQQEFGRIVMEVFQLKLFNILGLQVHDGHLERLKQSISFFNKGWVSV